jgi:hypothetical protein
MAIKYNCRKVCEHDDTWHFFHFEQINVLNEAESCPDHPESNTRDFMVKSQEEVAVSQEELIKAIVENAKVFGNVLIGKFTIENISMGITQAGKTYDLTMYCHKLIHFIEKGSLYAALQELDILLADTSQTKTDLSPFVTNDRLTIYKEEIETYLGV